MLYLALTVFLFLIILLIIYRKKENWSGINYRDSPPPYIVRESPQPSKDLWSNVYFIKMNNHKAIPHSERLYSLGKTKNSNECNKKCQIQNWNRKKCLTWNFDKLSKECKGMNLYRGYYYDPQYVSGHIIM